MPRLGNELLVHRALDEAHRTMTEAQWQRLSIRQPALNRTPGAGNARGGRPIP
ncbi:MAG: hypothetical protein K2X99_06950 [Gemmatimonadaceae bacterium]|nr:hypothetical protein [Gemmatimonadaceae bacterium]